MTIEKLPEKKTGRPLMLGIHWTSENRESFPYIMHIVDEPRKFSPSNVLTHTVLDTSHMYITVFITALIYTVHMWSKFQGKPTVLAGKD